MDKSKTKQQLRLEVEGLRTRLEEAEETLRAIRSGEVDALVVSGPQGDRLYTLEGADQSYRILFETMEEGAATLGVNGTILYCNRRLAEMLGTALEKVIGSSMEEYLSPEDWQIFKNIEKRGSAQRREFDLKRDDRSRIPALISFGCLEIGVLQGTCMTVTDLTFQKRAEKELRKAHDELERRVRERTEELVETNQALQFEIIQRKGAEEKLKESERLYRAIGESINYGIWVCDPEGRNTYASESFLKLVGLTQDQCSEFGWGNVLHPEDAERTIAAWKECVRTGGRWDIEHRFRGVDGQLHPILARGLPVRDEQGEIICWAGINLDISGPKQLEEKLRRSRDELESRVQERTEELQKSQQRLQQLASQLIQAQEKERKRIAVEMHDGLLSEMAAMKYLFEGKLMLFRKGQLADTKEFDNVTDIMQKVMKDARGIMNNLRPSILDEMGLIPTIGWLTQEYQKSYGHIQIRKQVEVVEKDIPDVLKVVMFRVLQEALNNFAKHGRGNLVELSLLKSAEALHFQIQDNGQGFDVETVPKGLGLESMRERVELSGGEFQIKSTIGQGTTIRAIWRL